MDAIISFQQMSVANRLGEYFLAIGTSVHQVTKRCGFTRGALDKMLRKGGGLHSDTISVVLAHYPDLDADWLLLGIGNMKRESPRKIVGIEGPKSEVRSIKPRPKNNLQLEELKAVRRLLEEHQKAVVSRGNVTKKKAG